MYINYKKINFYLYIFIMKPFQKRMIGFLFGCIAARGLLTFIAKNINNHYLPYIGYFLLIISATIIYQYITKSIKEAPLGGPIWWDHLRPIFAIILETDCDCLREAPEKSAGTLVKSFS